GRGKETSENIIEIGKRLTECKKLAGRGNWLPWLDREFGWKEQTARNFMQAYELSLKSPNFGELDVPVSALCLLAAPSTPDAAKTEILARAKTGKSVTVAEVKRVVERHKGRKEPRDPARARLPNNLD